MNQQIKSFIGEGQLKSPVAGGRWYVGWNPFITGDTLYGEQSIL